MVNSFFGIISLKMVGYRNTILCICIIAFSAIASTKIYLDQVLNMSQHQLTAQYLLIQPKTSSNNIVQQLAQQHLCEPALLTKAIILLYGYRGRLKSGEYYIPMHYTLKSVLDLIVSGKVVLHSLTIPEGLTSYQIIQLLNSNVILSGPFIKELAEGTLLPDTYKFPRGMMRQKLVQQMQQAMRRFLQQALPNNQTNLSAQDIMTLASLVEMETAIPNERPVVASVFLNRLKINMALQCDATVIYALSQIKGQPFNGRLSRQDLRINYPCNTYVHTGLPPNPICHPGRAAIQAALYPAITPYLYFVADGQGGHIFASTLSQHQINHQNWRKIRAGIIKNSY